MKIVLAFYAVAVLSFAAGLIAAALLRANDR